MKLFIAVKNMKSPFKTKKTKGETGKNRFKKYLADNLLSYTMKLALPEKKSRVNVVQKVKKPNFTSNLKKLHRGVLSTSKTKFL